MTRSIQELEWASSLAGAGLNDCAISRRTGIPRSTIREWRIAGFTRPRAPDDCVRCAGREPSLPGPEYAYLLGIYLGDGCISWHARAYKLRLTLDARYPGIVAECSNAVRAIHPRDRAWVGKHGPGRCVEVAAYWQHWPCLFPQHGPGRKHDRPIRLEPWQRRILAVERRPFVRGLIHSDGCRIVANDRGRLTARTFRTSPKTSRDFCASRWTPSMLDGRVRATSRLRSTAGHRSKSWTRSSVRNPDSRRSRLGLLGGVS
jgi:hypothetical protein